MRFKLSLIALLILISNVLWAAQTPRYGFTLIPKYPDPQSENYDIYMDDFMNDVDTEIWNTNQQKLSIDTTLPATPACNTPTTGVETNSDGSAYTWMQMTWGAVADADLREYEVRVKKDSETVYLYSYTNNLSTMFRPAVAAATYYFDVRAIDKQGNAGAYCTQVSVVAAQDTSAPAVPADLSLSTGIDKDNNGVSYVWVQADWTANTEKDIRSYKLRIKEEAGGVYSYATSNTNLLKFVNLKPNIVYYIAVSAIDASGNASNYTTDSIVTSGNDTSAPAVPSSLVANPGFQIIWLTWTGSSSTDVHKYEIYRSATNDVATASKVGETPGITYPDDDLPNEATYYYWVRAVDDFGNASGWSNPDLSGATATTLLVKNVDVFADLSALKITSGELKSTNWSTTAGSLYDLDDGAFYIGGSTNPKLSWNGTTLTIKGNVSVESGQTFSCTNCVDGTAVQFNYAASSGEGGNAINTDNVGGQSASTVNTGVGRATTGLNSSGQTTQLVDTANLPAISSGASKVVIGNEGIKLFNSLSQERVNINTDGTFRFGNASGDNLYWNGLTLVLTGRATIATSADSATNATNAGYATSAGSATTATSATSAGYATSAGSATTATTASSSNDLSCTDCVADTELSNIIDLNNGGITIKSSTAAANVRISSGGLYGYNASSTQTFGIDASNGNAYFGPPGNQISWDGSTLTVPAAKVTGTLSAATISANNISAGTITGATLQTASSGVRFSVSVSDGYAHFYDSGDTERVLLGQATYGAGLAGLMIGGNDANWTTYSSNGIIARTGTGDVGVYGQSAATYGTGVSGRGLYGIYGYSDYSAGVGVGATIGNANATHIYMTPYGGWSGIPTATAVGAGSMGVNNLGQLYYYVNSWKPVTMTANTATLDSSIGVYQTTWIDTGDTNKAHRFWITSCYLGSNTQGPQNGIDCQIVWDYDRWKLRITPYGTVNNTVYYKVYRSYLGGALLN